MKILEILANPEFPLKWAETEKLRENDSFRKEIYLRDEDEGDIQNGLIHLFYKLFGNVKDELLVYDKLWWEACLSVWNINSDEYDFDINSKPSDCRAYLEMLEESEVKKDYSGCCRCNNWDQFLSIDLRCIISGEIPYSPLFVHSGSEFFFYFHHTGSIGIYYKDEGNENIKQIFANASELYEIRD